MKRRESLLAADGCYEPMWDKRYSEPGYAYGKDPNGFLVSIADQIPPGRVLCVAEGEGRNAVYLAGLGYRVTAVDSSTVGLAKAEALAEERGVAIETVHEDLADYEIEPGVWQGIISIFCHLPPVVRASLHEQVLRGLAPAGVFILEGFTPRQLEYGTGGPKTPELLTDLRIVKQELPGLRFEIAREVEREITAGKYHGGTGSVVQILAVK